MSFVGTLTGALGGAPGGDLLGSAVGTLTQSVAGAGLSFIDGWVLNGTRSALRSVAHVIGVSTTPNLTSTWFSASYWRMAGLATLLTLPFLFAAAVHALLRSDLLLLSKAALVQLPLALLGVTFAAPLVALALAATDQMCAWVAAPGVNGGAHFLVTAANAIAVTSTLNGSPFLAVVVGMLTIAGALTLMLELLIREGAVYVVVLFLPLAFAALVWPARRVWAIRMFELLTALILSKFVIVAVLSLAGSALGHSGAVSHLLIAMALVLLSCLAPWALLRLIPFTELGAAVSETVRHHMRDSKAQAVAGYGKGVGAVNAALGLTGMLRSQAAAEGQADDGTSGSDSTDPDTTQWTGHGAYGYGSSSTDTRSYGSTGFAAAGVLAAGTTSGRSLPPGTSPQDGPTPDGGGSPGGGGDSPRSEQPSVEWWEAEDMSLPGIHLGSKGLGGPNWVPPTHDDADAGQAEPIDPADVDIQGPSQPRGSEPAGPRQ